MAKKKLTFTYDAPFTLSFSILCIVVFLIDSLILKNYLAQNVFLAPTSSSGTLPFLFTNVLSYLRIILYVFGFESVQLLLVNVSLILLLGPGIEEYYGSVVVGIMAVISIIVSGVLNACFCKISITGPGSFIFMMILLNGFIAFSKRKVSFSFIAVFLVFAVFNFMNDKASGIALSIVSVLINIAGGLCGSFIACLTSPKVRAEKRNRKKAPEQFAVSVDEKSPKKVNKRIKKQEVKNSDDEETIIGTF